MPSSGNVRFVDLCAGIGGFRMGLERAGFDCAGFCESDPYARQSYRAIYNTEGEWFSDDIRSVRGRDLPDIDLATAGFPCQSFSTAGTRGGFDDTRGTLFYALARVFREKQPEYLLLENVRGLLNHDGGATFSTILNVLGTMGYTCEWQVLDSRDFGVPQQRRRLYLVGHPGGSTGRKVFPIERTATGNAQRHENGRHTMMSDESGWRSGLYQSRGFEVKDHGRYSHTVKGGNGGTSRVFVTDGDTVRYLTPREYWRLQGFSDEAFEKARAVNSDRQLYRQASNAVTVPVVEAIAKRLYPIMTGRDRRVMSGE